MLRVWTETIIEGYAQGFHARTWGGTKEEVSEKYEQEGVHLVMWLSGTKCYITVGTFARRGLCSTAKTLRSLRGGQGSEY